MTEQRHFSASAIEAATCHRAWALRYLDGIKKPELTWEQCLEYDAHRNDPVLPPGVVQPQGGQRGAAAGKMVHLYTEWYLTGDDREHEGDHAFIGPVRRIDWSSLPGQILQSMVDHLPPAGSVPREDVERPIEIEVHGIRFVGYVDVVRAAARQIWDHKTSRDIRQYAKLPHAVALELQQPERSLLDDLQSAIYNVWFCRTYGGNETEGRWTYGETDKSRRALPVIQTLNYGVSLGKVMGAAMTAHTLLTYETSADAPANTLHCDAFGGCWYGQQGHCTELRDYGAILVALEQKAKDKETMAKPLSFNELRNRVAGAAPTAAPAPVVEAPAKATPGELNPATVEAAASATKAFRPRKPKAEPVVEAPAEQEQEPEETVAVEDLGDETPTSYGSFLSLVADLQAALPAGVTISISKAL